MAESPHPSTKPGQLQIPYGNPPPWQIQRQHLGLQPALRLRLDLRRQRLQLQAAQPEALNGGTQADERNLGQLDSGLTRVDRFAAEPVALRGTRREEELGDALERLVDEDVIQPVPRTAVELERRGQERAHGLAPARQGAVELRPAVRGQLAHQRADELTRRPAVLGRPDVVEGPAAPVSEHVHVGVRADQGVRRQMVLLAEPAQRPRRPEERADYSRVAAVRRDEMNFTRDHPVAMPHGQGIQGLGDHSRRQTRQADRHRDLALRCRHASS